MQGNFNYWHYPTEVTLGIGARSKAVCDAQSLGLSNPLLVCDKALLQVSTVIELIDSLKNAFPKLSLFSEIPSNPSLDCVNAGIQICQTQGHDGVIAIGGGSAIDTAKAIAFMTHQTGNLLDYEDIGDRWQGANVNKIMPCIAIPTTAGTGSEVGRVAVISDDAANKKRLIFHPNMMPKRVILDAELTISLPPMLTAATGMDALAHNLESYFSPEYHPMAKGIACEAIQMIQTHLPKAYAQPSHLESRQAMLVASLMGATAFQKGLGAMHALAHPLGARFNAHHGLLNAILMPYVLQANRPAIQQSATRLAEILQLKDPSFDALLKWVLELRTQCQIPHDLQSIDIHDASVDWIAEQAVLDPSAATNPIPFSKEQYRIILISAIHGELK